MLGVGERQAKWDVVKKIRQEEVWTKDLWAVGCAHRWGACLHVSPQPAPPTSRMSRQLTHLHANWMKSMFSSSSRAASDGAAHRTTS